MKKSFSQFCLLAEAKGIAPAMAARIVTKQDYPAWKKWQEAVQAGKASAGQPPHGLHTFRVDGWYCPRPPPDEDDWMGQIVWDSSQDNERLMSCHRKNATHVAASGVGGLLRPIEDIVVVGRVNWTPEQISDAEKRWNRRVAKGY